jgi:two-component system, NtrC family, C4-dicarboxylate transport response regulator DctD
MPSTVLIVEDQEDFRLTLADILRLDGWTAFVAASVDEALAVAQRGGIDIVLCDVILPRKRGPELRQAFAVDPALVGIPFVFMTGHAPHAEQLAPSTVLLKPFPFDRLAETLARVLAGGGTL